MLKKRILSAVSAVIMGFSCMTGMQLAFSSGENGITASAAGAAADLELPIVRISGENRYETAAAVSKQAYPDGAKSVVIANGLDYADALCGVPLAKALDAPVLLTQKNALPQATAEEIQRLGATTVYILGGTGVVDEQIENDLKESELEVVRVAGENRYGTGVQVAQKMQELAGKPALTAFFVCANDFPDALSISSVAAVREAPIFYVDKSGKVNDVVKEYLESCGKKLSFAYVIGGSGAVGDAVFEDLQPYFKDSGRYGADNRYNTNAYINNAFKGFFTGSDVYLATGKDFPDALTGGALAAKNGSPIVIADNKATDKQVEYLKDHGVSDEKKNSLYVLGGDGAVPESTARSVLLFNSPELTVVDGGTKATLSWSINRYVTSYQLYRDGTLLTTVTDPYKTTYTDTSLHKESSYTYRVIYNYKINGETYVSDASASLDRKVFDFRDLLDDTNSKRLNSVTSNTSKYTLKTENAQVATSTFTSYDIRLLKTGDWATLQKFAKEHFTDDMTKAEKVAYTVNWINKNVWYGTVQDGGWAKLMAMVNNGTFSYVNCIFNYKIGQCNCYNGALASMMLYLGYDAHLVMGYRGKVDANGKIVDKWQHFWCEVKINGQTYVMEAGNYGEDGDWMHVCELYKDVADRYYYTENNVTKAGWKGYIKNGKIAL